MSIEEVGATVQKRRKQLKMRQGEIADLSGVGINTLLALERGEGNPTLKTLLAVSEVLGLQVEIKLK